MKKTLLLFFLLASCENVTQPNPATVRGIWYDRADSIALAITGASTGTVTFYGANYAGSTLGAYPIAFTKYTDSLETQYMFADDAELQANWQAPSEGQVQTWYFALSFVNDSLIGFIGQQNKLPAIHTNVWDCTFTR